MHMLSLRYIIIVLYNFSYYTIIIFINLIQIIENDLHIELPPECQNNKIHYLETGLTSQLDKKKINLIYQLNPAFKSGRFSKEEDNIIHKYWSKFKEVCMIKIYLELYFQIYFIKVCEF